MVAILDCALQDVFKAIFSSPWKDINGGKMYS